MGKHQVKWKSVGPSLPESITALTGGKGRQERHGNQQVLEKKKKRHKSALTGPNVSGLALHIFVVVLKKKSKAKLDDDKLDYFST